MDWHKTRQYTKWWFGEMTIEVTVMGTEYLGTVWWSDCLGTSFMCVVRNEKKIDLWEISDLGTEKGWEIIT
jgi:hypothetical protein